MSVSFRFGVVRSSWLRSRSPRTHRSRTSRSLCLPSRMKSPTAAQALQVTLQIPTRVESTPCDSDTTDNRERTQRTTGKGHGGQQGKDTTGNRERTRRTTGKGHDGQQGKGTTDNRERAPQTTGKGHHRQQGKGHHRQQGKDTADSKKRTSQTAERRQDTQQTSEIFAALFGSSDSRA